MPPKNMKKAAASKKTSAATSAVTATEGQKTKRKNADTPGSVKKKQKMTNAVKVDADSEEGEADAGREEPTGDDGDGGVRCLVRPDKAWALVERSHVDKQPAASHKMFFLTNASVSQLEEDEIDNIIPPKTLPESLFPPNWTQQDEQDLQRAWDEDPERPVWMDIPDKGRFTKLWKVFLRLFRKSPADVISAKYALQFDPDKKRPRMGWNSKNELVVSPAWTALFMKRLMNLAFHPLWQGKVECLIVAIQYAVIVRTNDCRTWKLLNPTGDEFFNTMIRVLQKPDCQGMEMSKLHKMARDDMHGRDIPCGWFSMFMEKLEGKYPKPPPRQTEDNGPYKVSTADLGDILEALTDMDHLGLPLFRYTGEGYSMEAANLNMKEDLPANDDMLDYYERGLLEERRWVALQKKLADRGRPVESLTGLTVSAEATGSGSTQTDIDQLNERIRELEDDVFEWQRKYKRLQGHNPVPSSDAIEDPNDSYV
ncbi:hypothetical protein CGCVW01_v001565 [Colletotrichum viniferum]|nr:hypothetical protein CGCVW01_v001565 [Colletotrichum viniferum]